MRNPSIENRPRDSLTAQVLRELTARIERGELNPGDRLPTERELMANYRVSRTVVREAISSLRASGRIDTQQGRGAFVRSPPVSFRYALDASDLDKVGDVLHIMDLRIGLESEAASLAAKRHSAAQLNDIHAALKKLETDITSADQSAASDVQFHWKSYARQGNVYFVDLFRQLAPVMIPGRASIYSSVIARPRSSIPANPAGACADLSGDRASRSRRPARAAIRLHLPTAGNGCARRWNEPRDPTRAAR